MIRLKHCAIERTPAGCTSTFNDGTVVHSVPHPHDPHYSVIAHRLGYCDDLHVYCYEHDFAHHFVAEYLFGLPSPALFGVAHNSEIPQHEAAYEEMSVQMFQRWLRANEQPIIAGVNWHDMKAKAIKLLEA